ncbi:hypothetical protein K2X85_11450 [bacterium]|nr:hypothetical protein [bacterium]
MPVDSKLLEAAEGFLELGLAEPALESLEGVSPKAREEDAYSFHSLAGEAYRLLQNYDSALGHLLQAKKSRSNQISTYIGLGWCWKRLGKLDKAIESLQEAEVIALKSGEESSLALVLFNLACYYSLAGQKELMLDRLRKAFLIEANYRHSVADESDFDPFRDDPDFVQLISEVI